MNTPRTDAVSRLAQPITEGMPIQEMVGINFARQLERELAAAQAKLSKFESAAMPEEPPNMFNFSGDPAVFRTDYNKLRTACATQTVRADENERDARRYRGLRDTVAATSGPAICMRVYDGYHFQLRGVACDKETDKALAAGKGE